MTMDVQITGIDELRKSIRAVRAMEPMRSEVLLPAAKLGRSVAQAQSGPIPILYRTTRLSARVYTKDYRARFIEGGRKPASKLPPVNNPAFQEWAESKGIQRQNLYVVARAIARRGVKGRFFMKKGREAVADALPRLLDNCAKALERLWGEE